MRGGLKRLAGSNKSHGNRTLRLFLDSSPNGFYVFYVYALIQLYNVLRDHYRCCSRTNSRMSIVTASE